MRRIIIHVLLLLSSFQSERHSVRTRVCNWRPDKPDWPTRPKFGGMALQPLPRKISGCREALFEHSAEGPWSKSWGVSYGQWACFLRRSQNDNLGDSVQAHPPNLTILARRHGGTFPEEYVTNVLRFGPGFSTHGSSLPVSRKLQWSRGAPAHQEFVRLPRIDSGEMDRRALGDRRSAPRMENSRCNTAGSTDCGCRLSLCSLEPSRQTARFRSSPLLIYSSLRSKRMFRTRKQQSRRIRSASNRRRSSALRTTRVQWKRPLVFSRARLNAEPLARHDTNPAFSSALSKPKINSFSSCKIRWIP